VTGYPAAAPGQPMQPMAVAAGGPVQGSPAFLDQQPCGCCTLGWVLFGVSAWQDCPCASLQQQPQSTAVHCPHFVLVVWQDQQQEMQHSMLYI
jgi:hypothetical protein